MVPGDDRRTDLQPQAGQRQGSAGRWPGARSRRSRWASRSPPTTPLAHGPRGRSHRRGARARRRRGIGGSPPTRQHEDRRGSADAADGSSGAARVFHNRAFVGLPRDKRHVLAFPSTPGCADAPISGWRHRTQTERSPPRTQPRRGPRARLRGPGLLHQHHPRHRPEVAGRQHAQVYTATDGGTRGRRWLLKVWKWREGHPYLPGR